MTPELIIFDCDGVLVDSEPVVNALLAANLTRHGLPVTMEECISLFVGGTMLGVEQEARRLGADLPPDWQDEIYSEMFARLEQGVDLIPGVLDVLDRVEARGIAKAIASNGPTEKMRRTLVPSGLWDRFDPHIYSRQDHAPKPKPDMIFHAIKVAGVDPSRAVMIDDTASGCKAAQNAGIRCIGFAAEGQGAKLAEVGAEPVSTMAEVAQALKI